MDAPLKRIFLNASFQTKKTRKKGKKKTMKKTSSEKIFADNK